MFSELNFSDEEFYVIDEDAVVSIAPMSKEAIRMYSRWVKKEILHQAFLRIQNQLDEKTKQLYYEYRIIYLLTLNVSF